MGAGSGWKAKGHGRQQVSGSEFHVILPIEAKIDWDDDETKGIILRPDEQNDAGKITAMAQNIDKKPTILFIDSDREAVEIARMVLENAFEVLVAETGEIGLMTAFNSKPSIILLDSYLPEWTGTVSAKSSGARRNQKNPHCVLFRRHPERRNTEMLHLRRR